MRQAQFFIDSEGDRWFERNRERLGEHDPVSAAIEQLHIKPTNVLEIGCCNGWRLAALRDKYGCNVMGLDPSHAAVEDARKRSVSAWEATAAGMPIRSHAYDVVIYGFCLYLTDPEDWFRIASEGDRVLKDGGYLIIHDFEGEPDAFARVYEHAKGILSYHVDFAGFWLAHPWYEQILTKSGGGKDDWLTVLRKNTNIRVVP
jgi:ubiquinone/menaquinone biosynthesis C-methylase UbiE